MSERLRVAVIGCGNRGREHLRGFAADSRAEIVALAEPIPATAEACRDAFAPEARLFAEPEALLAEMRPDIVVIALWPHLHLPVFAASIDAGARAVLCEKPIAPTWRDCVAMGQLAETRGVQLTFCHQRRFAAGNRRVRQLLAEGRFGTLQRMDLYSPMHLLDCGTHSVDQALSFNGESPGVWVHGAVDVSETIDWFGVRAETMATGLIHFANGVQATLRTGKTDMDLWGGVRAIGTDGFIEVFWDGQIRRAVVYSDPTWAPPPDTDDPSAQMAAVVQNALDCLESGDEPELSHRKALRAAEILFGLYESAVARQRVDLPLPPDLGHPLHDLLDWHRS